jgi:cystathionine gamma-synthase
VTSPHHIDTVLVNVGRPSGAGEPLNHPVVPASNFAPGGSHWYSRSDGTETVDAFELAMGQLDGGRSIAFGSGMAAVAAVLEQVPIGGRVVIGPDTYHGVSTLLSDGVSANRWTVDIIEHDRTSAWVQATAEADMVWLESPSNPRLDVSDLPAICGSRPRKALVAVDSTFATPLGQRPLELGADVVVHSATKFVGGHSDLLAGVATTDRPDLAEALRRRRTLSGASPGALETFLALRGLRTMGLRLERASASAAELAARLESHPSVARVRYPGLASDPGHALARSFMTGFGAVVSFEVAHDEAADRVVGGFGLIHHATSLGGVETTAERRSGYPGSDHIPPGLIRMSVGCEHVDDLWKDLSQALDRV